MRLNETRRIENPLSPLNEVISDFHRQTLLQLQVNFATQHIYPYEVYPGYHQVNEARKKRDEWYSTGEGIRSIDGSIVRADEGGVTLEYRFNDYLRYVDIGVGGKVRAGDVERGKNVRFRSRYVSRWDRSSGRSHRPAVMAELRHLQTRVRDYLVDFWGLEGEVNLLNTFDGLNIDLGNW